MTSTILSNKNFMPAFRFELKRIWFCFIVFPVLSVIGLVAAFGMTVSDSYYAVSSVTAQATDITKKIAYNGGYFMIILMAVGCSIIISNIYSPFYSKRKTDFFQSLPVTRSTQYVAKTLALLSVTAASYAVAVIGVIALKPSIPAKMNIYVDTVLVLKFMVVAFICSAALICIAQFCAITAGKRWQYWLLLIGVAVCVPIAVVELLSVPGHLLLGASFYASNLGGIISPAFIYMLAISSIFRLRYLILSGIIISVVSFAFGWRLLEKRKSECAEQSVSSQTTVSLAVFGAMGCAASLVFILPFKQKQYIIMAVCAAIAAAVTAVICSLIYNRKEISKSLVVTAIVTILIFFTSIAVCGSGGFGYTEYMPDTEEIASARIELGSQYEAVLKGDTPFTVPDMDSNDGCYEYYNFKNKNSFSQIANFQKECIKRASNSSPNNIYGQIRFIYKLKDGTEFRRIYEAPRSAAYSLNAVAEAKESKPFVNAGIDNVCAVSYQSNVYSASAYSDVLLDVDKYYPALVSDYMTLTRADFQQCDNDVTDISTLNFTVFYVTKYASEEQRKAFSKMTFQQLQKYYDENSVYGDKSALGADTVILPITSSKVPKLMKSDGYLIDSKRYNDIKTEDIEKMFVTTVEYSESQMIYNVGSGFGSETLYILGSDVVKKDFGSEESSDMFETITDKEMISKTFSLVRDNADQYTLFKQNNKFGYAVVFGMKDGSYSKVYYVPEVPGYQGLQ